MSQKNSSLFIALTRKFIGANSTKEMFRLNEIDFTRNRKLPFEILVLSMLKLFRKSLASEIQSIFDELNNVAKKITASAFVQSRKKVKPELFATLNHLIVSEYYTDNDENIKLYKGMRLLAIDGSSLNLPVTEDTMKHYGVFNNQIKKDDLVIGRVSVLYDVLNDFVIDGLLRPYNQGEVTLSREHFQYLQKGDLVVMDRAYPSFESAYLLQQKDVHFLFRCKESFSNQVRAFSQSGKLDSIVQIKAKQNKSFKDLPYNCESNLTVRLLRIELKGGETEILMISLLDLNQFPLKEFKQLYFKRWRVETFYDRLKNSITVERFSGTSHQFIQQEFNCAIYMSNMQTILTQEAQKEVDEKCKDRKYEYRVNQSLSLGFIRERLLKMYTQTDKTEEILLELKKLFTLNPVPIRNGRKYARDPNKYRQRTKPIQFKNRRLN